MYLNVLNVFPILLLLIFKFFLKKKYDNFNKISAINSKKKNNDFQRN